MTAKQFGARLRELRKQRGLTQRELAEQVGVNFSYLSKIEGGVVPPPSQKVISRIAIALKTNESELITLAGRIPPDIAQTLKRSKTAQRLIRVSNKIREG
ncbi:MAG: helix-turn-helix transcriptional regulator, partial [Dehalococcoidales bacterium]